MKRSHFAILAALALVTAPALATTVTVHIGDPGYYGPVTVAGYPRPQLIYAEPVIVQRSSSPGTRVYPRACGPATKLNSYCGLITPAIGGLLSRIPGTGMLRAAVPPAL